MKRWTIVLTACAVLMAAAGTAGAKPPDGKGNPGGGGKESAPIEVVIDKANESTWWLHEVDDIIIYDVAITNTTNAVITDADVTGDISFLGETTLDLTPGTTVLLATYAVVQADVDSGAVVSKVTVTHPDGAVAPVSASYTQEVDPIDECTFAREMSGTEWTGRWVKTAPAGDTCIFKPARLVRADGSSPTVTDAHWTFSVRPDVDRPTGVLFTMRDGIPGNWCSVPDPASGYFTNGPPLGYYDEGNDAVLGWDPETISGRGRWKPGDPPITRHFYFPPGDLGSVPNELTGVCLNLGAGGDMIGVGNTESFYLVAPGTVTVEERRGFPPSE
jgi:hypothetical protein